MHLYMTEINHQTNQWVESSDSDKGSSSNITFDYNRSREKGKTRGQRNSRRSGVDWEAAEKKFEKTTHVKFDTNQGKLTASARVL